MDGPVEAGLRDWEETTLADALRKHPEREAEFKNLSGMQLKGLYTPLDTASIDYCRDLGFPGQYPFTRGVNPTMYRSRIWSSRQLSGHPTPEQSNELFKEMLKQGQTGVSIQSDVAYKNARDCGDPLAAGSVGFAGNPLYSLQTMELMLDGIEQDKVYTNISGPHPIGLAIYLALARKRSVPFERLSGNTPLDWVSTTTCYGKPETDISPAAMLRLTGDVIQYCIEHIPRWNPVNVALGHCVKEAWATSPMEIAWAVAHATLLIDELVRRGVDVDKAVSAMSLHLGANTDFFEEIAKFRAARRTVARVVKARYGLTDAGPLTRLIREHCQTLSSTVTAKEPENNIIRTTIQAMAAILGGVQSLHITTMDDALGVPSGDAIRIALRTQQILAYESGVANVVDPLGGSYYMESLTNEMERQAKEYLAEIENEGGLLKALESGWAYQRREKINIEQRKKLVLGEIPQVGVTAFASSDKEPQICLVRMDPSEAEKVVARFNKMKAERDNDRVQECLGKLRQACQDGSNVMPALIDAAAAYATVGEIGDLWREVFGIWKSPATVIMPR